MNRAYRMPQRSKRQPHVSPPFSAHRPTGGQRPAASSIGPDPTSELLSYDFYRNESANASFNFSKPLFPSAPATTTLTCTSDVLTISTLIPA